MTTFNVVSDLHLEFNKHFNKELKEADYLIIAGDFVPAGYLVESNKIDVIKVQRAARNFADKYFKQFKKVFFVPGNHDFYGIIYYDLNKIYDDFFKEYKNFKILNNDIEIIDNFAIIGTPLWTDFKKGDPLVMFDVERSLNDYRYIGRCRMEDVPYLERKQYNHNFITANFILQQHDLCVSYIDKLMQNNRDKDVIIISHHLPSTECLNPEFKNNLDHAFASDLDWIMEKNRNIKYWIHGHNHFNTDMMIYDTRVLSNQFGYPREAVNKEFRGDKVIEL